MSADAFHDLRQRQAGLNLMASLGTLTDGERAELESMPQLIIGDGGVIVLGRSFTSADEWAAHYGPRPEALAEPTPDDPATARQTDDTTATAAEADDVGEDVADEEPTDPAERKKLEHDRFLFGPGYSARKQNRPKGGNVIRSQGFSRGD